MKLIANKRLGQHFLHERSVIRRIVELFHPKVGEIIVEIGPGLGALTYELLDCDAELHVIELDGRFACELQRSAGNRGLVVHHADALRFDYCSLCCDAQKLRLIGNLPYNISTPLLFWLLDQSRCIADMFFMMQKEVAQRLTAQPGTKDYGRLSVMIQWRCQVESMFTVGPGVFSPAPKVDSTVVRLVPYSTPPVEVQDPEYFATIVRQAFSQRRKTLRNSLGSMFDAADIEKAGIDPSVRAERVSVAQFARLSAAKSERSSPSKSA
ncbi:MAG: 16S rRNA (adenine(1518)-N(6)/adenine(1519)-N(6))-dimethyltransferase RsmA [Gammaproteobacteria bacterium]|nr:16S rRNA (adenine(1518)-N(6)/adenine(1519)-N(6))-dimethyltransferase RsmA [Gammaproteobacteria bacterium]